MDRFKYIFLYIFLFSLNASGQQLQGANWLFGGNGQINEPGTHLDFTGKDPNGIPFQYDYNLGAGVATISDKNGQLLFFSSMGHVSTRIQVNNRYQEMPNGNVFVGSNQTTTAELITRDPATDSVYYIFFITNHANGYHDLYFAKVDMRLNNGLGDVVLNSLRLLKKKVAPGMAAMLHTNERDTWLVTQNAASDSIQANLISPAGIGSPVHSLTNNPRTDPYYAYTRIKGSTSSDFIVAKGATERQVKIYDFDRSSGTIGVNHVLTISNPTQGCYSYAFSPDNSKLYVGSFRYLHPPGACFIYQYDLAAGSTQSVQQSEYIIPVPTNSNFVIDMQLAIDGKLYISRNDTVMYLSRINCPNLPGNASGFELRAIKILGGTSSLVILPSLNQTVFRNAGILQAQAHQDTICFGGSVQLRAYGAGAGRFRWQPANGLSAPADTLANPVVNPTETTTYVVTGSGNCHTTLTASVTVVVVPPKPAIGITGPVSVSSQMQGVWYKVQNLQKLPVAWGVSGGVVSANLNDSIRVQWGDTTTNARVWATIKAPAGCPGNSDTLNVKIKIAPKPVFYNIITPNNDNRNDVFTIGNLAHYPQNKLEIYNRWGKRVYQANNYRNNWNAENVSNGVYYYYFTASGQSWKGWFEVMK